MIIHKYLLVCLFVPFLLGVVAGCVGTVHMGWDIPSAYVFAGMGLVLCTMIICNQIVERHEAWNTVFMVCTFLLLGMFGYMRSAIRHKQFYALYGKEYKYEIYKQNNMQSAKALEWQQSLHKHIQEACNGNKDEKSIIEAISIGYKKDMSTELKKTFAAAGISHLLALSGFHLSIIYIMLYLLFASMRTTSKGRYVSCGITLMVIWSYAAITGMSPSLVRATIFCTIIEICYLLQREVRMINSCALAAIIILLIDPLMIGHVGFQLSFLCITGIALMQKRIPHNPILAIIVFTVICSLVTFPLVTHYFGTMPVYGLLGNLAGTLFAYPIVIFSLLWWILSLMGLPVVWLLHITIKMVSALIYVANTISKLPSATISYRPSVPEVFLWYGIIVCIYLLTDMYFNDRSEHLQNQ